MKLYFATGLSLFISSDASGAFGVVLLRPSPNVLLVSMPAAVAGIRA